MWLPVIKSLRWLGHRFAGMSVCSVAGQSVPIVLHLNCPHGIIRGGFSTPEASRLADFERTHLGQTVEPSSCGVYFSLSGGCVLGEQVIDIRRKSRPRSYNGEHTGLSLRLNFD